MKERRSKRHPSADSFDSLNQKKREGINPETGERHTDPVTRIRESTTKGASSEEARAEFMRWWDSEPLIFWQALRVLLSSWFKNKS